MKTPSYIFSLLTLASASASSLAAADAVLAPSMVRVHGGEFLMGNAADPKNAITPSSEPVHAVKVKTFQLSKYETTVGQFRQFVQATGYDADGDCWKLTADERGAAPSKSSWSAPANAPGDHHPVMCVSWNDAQAYIKWLSQQTGRRFRLPSEAEWEYAARAGSAGRYPFGDDPAQLCKHANVFDRSGKVAISQLTGKTRSEVACDDQAGLTTVVGMYDANAFGLHDMLGNVGELVADCQHRSYEGAPADGSAWTKDCELFHGSEMVIHRGGGYNSGAIGAGPSLRGHAGRDNRSSLGEGFRVAEDVKGAADSRTAQTNGPGAFEAGVQRAQEAERARRVQATAKPM